MAVMGAGYNQQILGHSIKCWQVLRQAAVSEWIVPADTKIMSPGVF